MDAGHESSVRPLQSQSHWDDLYGARAPEELAWHEPVPSTLQMVVAHSTPDDPVIDVGGGTSRLALELIEMGYRDLTVLDLSAVALDHAHQLLGPAAERVSWIHADVTKFVPSRRWWLWHDRAVFHFLVDADQRRRYRSVAASAVVPGGVLVVATFGPDGPERCAGLPVCRYDGESLAAEFAPDFELIGGAPLVPNPIGGDRRPYVGVVLRRSASA